MVDRNNEKYRASMARAGRPGVTDEERIQARELRGKGWLLEDIANVLGRVKSTVHFMLKEAP